VKINRGRGLVTDGKVIKILLLVGARMLLEGGWVMKKREVEVRG